MKTADMPHIQELALKQGANSWAVKKWKTRKKVPLEWQVKLMVAYPGMFTFADFERIHQDLALHTQSIRKDKGK